MVWRLFKKKHVIDRAKVLGTVLPQDQPETLMPETNEKTTFRSCAFTWNNKSEITTLHEKLQYIGYSNEVAPTTGTPHLQGWAYAKSPMRLTGWKKVLPGAHIEEMRGTFAQNDVYCSKSAELIHLGTRPMGNGQRRDLKDLADAVVDAATTGKRLSEVVTEEENRATFVQYHNGITALYRHAVTEKLRRVDKDFAPEVHYIYGAPGSGKTRYVYDQEPGLFRVPDHDGYKWKDGYAGEDAVLYDNMSIKNCTRPEALLQEIDRYFIQVPVKGGYIGWRPKRIYITSVYPMDIFSIEAGFSHPAEFTRRVTHQMSL